MTDPYFEAFVLTAKTVPSFTLVRSAVAEATAALADEAHDTAPLVNLMATKRGRDALLMYVITEGDEDTMQDALTGTGTGGPVATALDSVLLYGKAPNHLVDAGLAYLQHIVLFDEKVIAADDEVKANLCGIAAVLAFWKNDVSLMQVALDMAGDFGGNNLCRLVSMVAERGITPAWVTSDPR